ncbi:sensor histidine kinase [Streptomyces lavendulae]|uniref:sensor histidine kinase n=1 Tax=Streptomyces lavendulae TaxID=1914 RepID=UPI0036EF9987
MAGVLRAPDGPDTGSDAGRGPQPGLDGLDRLMADSGLDVTLTGQVPRDAGPAVQRAAYRTVREALTNVRKHAPGSAVEVAFHRSGTAVEVTVANTVGRHPALGLPSARHGPIGVRERAEQLGGALPHGPTPDGGYLLPARLPLGPRAARPVADGPARAGTGGRFSPGRPGSGGGAARMAQLRGCGRAARRM